MATAVALPFRPECLSGQPELQNWGPNCQILVLDERFKNLYCLDAQGHNLINPLRHHSEFEVQQLAEKIEELAEQTGKHKGHFKKFVPRREPMVSPKRTFRILMRGIPRDDKSVERVTRAIERLFFD